MILAVWITHRLLCESLSTTLLHYVKAQASDATRGLVAGLAEIDRENQYTLFSAGETPSSDDWPTNFQPRPSAIPARWLTVGWHRLRLPIPAELLTGDCDLYHSPDYFTAFATRLAASSPSMISRSSASRSAPILGSEPSWRRPCPPL